MTDYVLAGLVKRRAALAGEVISLRARMGHLARQIAALDKVIRQFDP